MGNCFKTHTFIPYKYTYLSNHSLNLPWKNKIKSLALYLHNKDKQYNTFLYYVRYLLRIYPSYNNRYFRIIMNISNAMMMYKIIVIFTWKWCIKCGISRRCDLDIHINYIKIQYLIFWRGFCFLGEKFLWNL